MPDQRIRRHTPAIAGQFDARPFAGKAAFVRDGNNITLAGNSAVFWDLPAFLHGYSCRASSTLADLVNAEWVAQGVGNYTGTFTMGINADDKFFITNSHCPFFIRSSAANELFGFPSGGVAASANTHTATGDWRRGVFEMTAGLHLQADGHAGNVNGLPSNGFLMRVQSLPTWLRSRSGTGVDDDIYQNKTLDDAFHGEETDTSLCVEPDGRVSINYSSAASFAFTADGQALWRRLGGTGRETAVAASGSQRVTLTTEHPAPCFLALDRGYISMRRVTRAREERVLMADGSVVSAGLDPVQGWKMEIRVTGPAFGYRSQANGPASAGISPRNMEDRLRMWWQYARRELTIYPQWGDRDHARGSIDIRRHKSPTEIHGASALYSTTFTTEAETAAAHWGRRKGGRLMVRRDPRDSQREVESYGGSLDVHQDIELTVLDDPTR
jgi:hypothetical protein